MKKALSSLVLSALIVSVITLAACGGSYTAPLTPVVNTPEAVPVSLTIGDDPPAGVAILRFQVQITSATLQPSVSTDSLVSVLLGPMNVELLHLQTETAPLGNIDVPAGTYTGLTASFANPEMTIYNNSGQTLTVGTQTCAANQFCILNPTLSQASASVESPTTPFPLTLSSTSPVGFEMHFDVNASVQGNLSVTPTITLKQIVPPTATTPINQFHLTGRVSSVSSPDFTIQTGFGALSANIVTNSSTTYNFGQSCTADDFACAADGQVVDVALNLLPGGTLVATDVRLLEQPSIPSLQGVVVSVNAADNQFNLLLMDMQEAFTSVSPGLLVSVQINSGASFGVESDGVTIPSGLTFTGVAGLVAGQTVEIHPVATPVVTPNATVMPQVTVSTDSITLEATQISGTVGTINTGANPPNFTLTALSPLFAHASIGEIVVVSVAGTQFINVSGLSGLSTGNTVSVGGLLFNTSTNPTIVAEGVRLH